MTPVALHSIDELLTAIDHLKALHSDATVIPFGRCRARDRVFAIAERLKAEKAAPAASKAVPFGWRNMGEVTTDSSVGTPGGREL